MAMSIATDKLRALLDKRGVEWFESVTRKGLTWIYRDGKAIRFHPWQPDTLKVSMFDLTPEQAIAATLGAGTIDKAAERIEVLSGFAREYLHRYGYLMSAAGEDVTDEVWAIEQVISEVCGAKVVDLREKS